MPTYSDKGGYWALAGFLYQVIGLLSFGEAIKSVEAENSDTNIDAYLQLEDVGNRYHAEHESFGQDAAFINSDDEVVLVQFKYTTRGRTIGIGELRDILKNLEKSAEEVLKNGLNVTACVLATNRNFTRYASNLWQVEVNKDRNYDLRYEHYSMEAYENKLIEFGKSLGALEKEIDDAIDKLIGKIMRDTGSGESEFTILGDKISIENLKEAFTLEREARQITEEKVKEKVDIAVAEFMDAEVGATHDFETRRAVLDEIGRACSQNALVVLTGVGGCGKTVTLWQWAKEKNFIGIKSTTSVNVYPMADELCHWAELSQIHDWRTEKEEKTLERFKVANPNYPSPIFHLALDGVDEEAQIVSDREIRRIVNWFCEEDKNSKINSRSPVAALVVTCRNFKEFERKWQPSVLGHGRINTLAEIAICNFSDEELTELVERVSDKKLSETVKSIIRDIIMTETPVDSEFEILGSISRRKRGSFSRFRGQILESIQHPVIFGSFLLIDEGCQIGVLRNDEDSLNELAQIVVSRFIEKIITRGRLQNRDDDELLYSLGLVARKNGPSGSREEWFNINDWNEPLMENGLFDQFNARRLLRETASGGIINLDSPERWQWTHPWIHTYLVSGD